MFLATVLLYVTWFSSPEKLVNFFLPFFLFSIVKNISSGCYKVIHQLDLSNIRPDANFNIWSDTVYGKRPDIRAITNIHLHILVYTFSIRCLLKHCISWCFGTSWHLMFYIKNRKIRSFHFLDHKQFIGDDDVFFVFFVSYE